MTEEAAITGLEGLERAVARQRLVELEGLAACLGHALARQHLSRPQVVAHLTLAVAQREEADIGAGVRWLSGIAESTCAVLGGPPPPPPPPPPRDRPRRDAPVSQHIGWVRERLRGTAGDLTAWEMVGDIEPVDALCEIVGAGIGLARQIGAPERVGELAAQAERAAAIARWNGFAGELRRRIWPLGRSQATGSAIMAAAAEVNLRHGHVLPSELLLEETRRIAFGAVPRRRRRGR